MEIKSKADDLISTFAGAPKIADALRRTQLKTLSGLAESERAAQDAERKRIEKKYGVNSPQAKAAAKRVTSLDWERDSIQSEIVRQSVPTPEVKPDSFVVYGRVLDPSGAPLSKATVAAVDTSGTTLATSTTDDLGTFTIRVSLASGSGNTKEGSPAASTTNPVTFQLQITERKSGLQFTNPETFQAVAGMITYREISIPEESLPQRQAARAPKRSK